MILILVVAVGITFWLACGIWGAGYYFAYFQGQYPELARRDYHDDRRKAIISILFGPASLIVEWSHRTYGWRLK